MTTLRHSQFTVSCSFCDTPASYRCDFVLDAEGRICSVLLCYVHRRTIGDEKHFCPQHDIQRKEKGTPS